MPFTINKFWAKVLVVLVVLAIAIVPLTGCGRSQPRGWSGPTAVAGSVYAGSLDGRVVRLLAAVDSPEDGRIPWANNPEAGRLGPEGVTVAIYSSPVVVDNLVIAGGYDGKLYAFDAESGAFRWERPREAYGPIVGGMVAAQGRFYFGSSDGSVYALEAATGDKVWSFETGDKVWSTPAIVGDTLYVTSFGDELYALNIADGSQKWVYDAGGAIVATPVVVDGTIFFGTFDRHVYAVNAADGSLKWQSETNGGKWFWSAVVVHEGKVYAPNLDGLVYILDAQNGREAATAVNMGNQLSAAPVIVGSKVILATEEGTVFALDTNSLERQLIIDVREEHDDIAANSSREIKSPLAAADGVVYIKAQSANEDVLYAVDVETGESWAESLVMSEGE